MSKIRVGEWEGDREVLGIQAARKVFVFIKSQLLAFSGSWILTQWMRVLSNNRAKGCAKCERIKPILRFFASISRTIPLLSLSDLVHPHIVRPKLSRDRRSRARRASERFSPLPRPRTQARYICEVGRQCCGSISSHETNHNSITECSSPVWVQFSAHCCFTEFVLIDGEQSLRINMSVLLPSQDL
jgi:hypothetical protein